METPNLIKEDDGRDSAPFANEYALGAVPEPAPKPTDEIRAIADEIPSAEEITKEAGTFLRQKGKLENIQGVMEETIEESKRGEESAAENKKRNEARLAEIDKQMAGLEKDIDALKMEDRRLGDEIIQHSNEVAWADEKLRGLDGETEKSIKAIEQKLGDDLASVLFNEIADNIAISEEYHGQLTELMNMKVEEEADAKEVTEMIGQVTSDAEGNLSASRPNGMNRIDDNVGNSVASENAKQTAWGGEVAADLTKAEMDKVFEEIDGKRKALRVAAEADKIRLNAEAEGLIENEKRMAEDKKEKWTEMGEVARRELSALEMNQHDVKEEISEKTERVKELREERDTIEAIVGVMGEQIEEYRGMIKTSEERLSRIMERLGTISEKGAGTIEALAQAEQSIETALNRVKAEAEILKFRLDKAVEEKYRGVSDKFEAAEKLARDDYKARSAEVIAPMLDDESLGIEMTPDGKIIEKPVGIEEGMERRKQWETVDPILVTCAADRDGRISEAREARAKTILEILDARDGESQQIEEARLAAVTRLSQAAETAKLVRETAVDVFGTGPITAEADTKKANLFSRGVSAIRRMFGGQ